MTEFTISIDMLYFLGIVGMLLVISWRAGAQFTKIETLFDGLSQKINRLENSTDDFTKRISKVEASTDMLTERIGSIEGRNKYTLISHSPESLSEKGKRILDEAGLTKYIEDNLDTLEVLMKSNKLETSYDIQETALDLFRDIQFNPDFERKIKESAYNEGISMELMRHMGGIYLRDKQLEKAKENTSDWGI